MQCNNALFEFIFVMLNQKLDFSFCVIYLQKSDVFPFFEF